MARTWTLYDTEALPSGYELEVYGHVAQHRDNLYFVAGVGSTNYKVFEYDIAGKTLTDISGGTFTGTFGIMDICRFGTQIYAAYRYADAGGGNYYGKLARWSGTGQTWVDTWTMEKDGDPAVYNSSNQYILDADFSNIYAQVYGETDTGWGVASSSDGATFSLDSTPSSYDIDGILSDNQHSGYSSPLAWTTAAGGDSNNVVQRLGGSWSYVLSGSPVTLSTRNLVGYTSDGYSIWRNTSTGALSKSTDWGQNLTSLGLTDTDFRTRNMQNLAGGRVIMLWGPGGTNQAYTWNFSTNQFDTDGTTGVSGNIITTFFMDTDGGLYALCNDNAAETVTIYKAETIDLAAIFYQTAYISDPTLNLKFALPFKGVNARGLDANFNDARALIGSKVPSATPVVVSVRPYSTYQNHYTNHPTDTEIVKVGWL